jgi:hypothetical protein
MALIFVQSLTSIQFYGAFCIKVTTSMIKNKFSILHILLSSATLLAFTDNDNIYENQLCYSTW